MPKKGSASSVIIILALLITGGIFIVFRNFINIPSSITSTTVSTTVTDVLLSTTSTTLSKPPPTSIISTNTTIEPVKSSTITNITKQDSINVNAKINNSNNSIYCTNCKTQSDNHASDCVTCAVSTEDLSWCNYIKDEKKYYSCIFSYHVFKKDLDIYCNSISDTFVQYLCYSTLALSNKNASYCNFIKEDELKFGCYVNYAKQTGDIKICNLSPNSSECYAYYAVDKGESNLCLSPDLSVKDQTLCVLEFSAKTKKVDACNILSGIANIVSCYSYAAIKNKDANLCSNLSDRYWKAFCYAMYGWEKDKDYAICQQIYNSPINFADQALCLGFYGQLSGIKAQICDQLKFTGITEADNKGLSLCQDTAKR